MADWRDRKIVDLLSQFFNQEDPLVKAKSIEDIQKESKQFKDDIYKGFSQLKDNASEWARQAWNDKSDHKAVNEGNEYLLNTTAEEWDSEKGKKALWDVSNHAGKIVADGVKNAGYGYAALSDLARERYFNPEDKGKYLSKAKDILGERRIFGPLGEIGSAMVSDFLVDVPLNIAAPGSGLAKAVASSSLNAVSGAAHMYQKLPGDITKKLVKAEEMIGINGMATRHGQKAVVKEIIPAADKASVAYGNAVIDPNKENYDQNRDFIVTLLAEAGFNPMAYRASRHNAIAAGRMSRGTAQKIADAIIDKAEIEGTRNENPEYNDDLIPKISLKHRAYESKKMSRAQAVKFKGPMDSF